jgi:1,4-alpha-glucan branching enzyme
MPTLLMKPTFLVFALAAIVPALAQEQPPVQSPEVHSDRSVTFRLRAPNAKEVVLAPAGVPRAPMQKDEAGVWTVSIGPLEPDYYE